MTRYDFITMNESNQAEAVWNGVFIADRETKEYRILLYAIDALYVQVFYDNICNQIKRFRPFKTGTIKPLSG